MAEKTMAVSRMELKSRRTARRKKRYTEILELTGSNEAIWIGGRCMHCNKPFKHGDIIHITEGNQPILHTECCLEMASGVDPDATTVDRAKVKEAHTHRAEERTRIQKAGTLFYER